MKIFITGGSGFIGQSLVKALTRRGHKLKILLRKDNFFLGEESFKNVQTIKSDLLSVKNYQEELEGVDVVLHLAAIRGEKPFLEREDYLKINVEGTKRFLEASRGKIKHFIFISSVSVTSDLPSGIGNENGEYAPSSWYGESKMLAEQLVNKYRHEGFKTTIVRPGIVYGPGDKVGFIPQMVKFLRKGFFVKIGSGNNLFPLIFIDDLIDLLIKVIDLRIIADFPLIAVSPEKTTLNDLIKMVSAELGTKPKIISLPSKVALMCGFCGDRISELFSFDFPITTHKVKNLSRHWWFDNRKTQRLLNLTPKTKIKEGLKKTINWFMESRDGKIN